jgi:hypothetical protein
MVTVSEGPLANNNLHHLMNCQAVTHHSQLQVDHVTPDQMTNNEKKVRGG